MNSNSAFPFTNTLLRQSYAKEVKTSLTSSQEKGSENEQTQASIDSYHINESFSEVHRNRCEDTPQFSRIKVEEEQSETKTAKEEQQLQNLLYSEDQYDEPSIREQPSFSKDHVLADILELNLDRQEIPVTKEGEEGLDYSQELMNLKANMVQLEHMAQNQIVKLKRQLEEERQIRANLEKKINKKTRSIGTNTDYDCRDDQISILKQSLLRHVELNKQLLKQEIKEQENMQNLINRVVL